MSGARNNIDGENAVPITKPAASSVTFRITPLQAQGTSQPVQIMMLRKCALVSNQHATQ